MQNLEKTKHLQQTVPVPLISFLCITYCMQTPATFCKDFSSVSGSTLKPMVGVNQKSGELMSLRILNQWQTRSWKVNITASLAINQDKLDVFSLFSRGPLRSWARYPQISGTEHTFYCLNSLSWFTSPLSQYFLGWPPQKYYVDLSPVLEAASGESKPRHL